MNLAPVLKATALALAAAASHAGAQITTARGPITAIAIGPSSATVDVNVNDGRSSHTVVLKKPVTAVSTPFRNMHVRIN